MKKFKKPTIEEVKRFIEFKNLGRYVDAEHFYWFYEAKDWFVGKNKMKKWKAAVSGWAAREKKKMGGAVRVIRACQNCGEQATSSTEGVWHCSKRECKIKLRGW